MMPGCDVHASVLSVRQDYPEIVYGQLVGLGEEDYGKERQLAATVEGANPGRSVRGVATVPLWVV